MKKIPTVFVRDRATGYVTGEVTPGCEWVLSGEGTATRKFDGTCVMFDGDEWWARREVKPGKTPPPGWVELDHDPATGKRVGWEPIEQSPFAKFWREAMTIPPEMTAQWARGTYELCGPRINGNPERFRDHCLVRHGPGWDVGGAENADVAGLIDYCRSRGSEGIVWWHPDGRRAKLKVRDYPTGPGGATDA